MGLESVLETLTEKVAIIPDLDLIIGPMYSGKTTEYINLMNKERARVRRAIRGQGLEIKQPLIERAIKRMVVNFKLEMDNRYSKSSVSTHDLIRMRATKIIKEKERPFAPEIVEEYLQSHPEVKVLGISELQFYPLGIVRVILNYKDQTRVIAEGLDKDKFRDPFETVALIMPHAKVISRVAECDYIRENDEVCGREARYTQGLINGVPVSMGAPRVAVGSTEEVAKKNNYLITYVPRCLAHHLVPGKDDVKLKIRHYKNN